MQRSTGAAATARPFATGRALRPSTKVLPEHARGHNRSLVLQTLYRAGTQSRADIARETGSDVVADVAGSGLGHAAILVDTTIEAMSIHRSGNPRSTGRHA